MLHQAVLIVNGTRVHVFALLFILLVLVLLAVLVAFGLVVIFRACDPDSTVVGERVG